jgi:hypothetical protein
MNMYQYGKKWRYFAFEQQTIGNIIDIGSYHHHNSKTSVTQFVLTISASKRIQLLLEYVNIKPNDFILDIGGNTGKITEGYSSADQCDMI